MRLGRWAECNDGQSHWYTIDDQKETVREREYERARKRPEYALLHSSKRGGILRMT